MLNFWSIFGDAKSVITFLWIVTLLIGFVIIFLERKDPAAALAWLLVLFCVPVVGIFLYFMLSQNISRRKIYKLSEAELKLYNEGLEEQTRSVEVGDYQFENAAGRKWKDMVKLHQTYSESFYTQGNSVSIITDGKEMFNIVLEDIKSAKVSISAEYFIMKDDFIGRAFLDALTAKAKEGVEVKLLLDAFGGRYLPQKRFAEFIAAGGQLAYFFPKRFKLWLNINYRNHRKLLVVDGNVGHIGGYNIAKEYLGYKEKMGYWRDTQLRVLGPAVQDMNARFLLDWSQAADKHTDITLAYSVPQYEDAGISGVQIVTSGPNSDKQEIKRGYMKMITSARKNVYIQTPYFVPDQSILESLKMAARSGVDVRLMIPCKPDHMFIYWATLSFAGELIEEGVRIFIYDNGFLHAKTISVDGEVCSVGSANFDRRSFKLNFEANAFIYDEAQANLMEVIFEEDMAECHELTKTLYAKRSLIVKFKESISRLISDIL